MPLSAGIRYGIIISLTVIVIIVAGMVEPSAQDITFHSFADARTLIAIPNCLNVISNIPFVLIGIYGLSKIQKGNTGVIFSVLFTGILLTGVGSAYYHYHPDNNTLVYDRIPMTIVFMAFLSATIAERINPRWGAAVLAPLVIMGIASVLWWHHTEGMGKGDLRFYMVVQFYPVVLIPIIFLLFPAPGGKQVARYFIRIIAWYLIAKVLERYDDEIFSALHLVSGHSLKHLAAAVSTWYILKIYRLKTAAAL